MSKNFKNSWNKKEKCLTTDFVSWILSNFIWQRFLVQIKGCNFNISMFTWFGSYLKYAHVGGPKSHKICLRNIWMVPYMQWSIRGLGMTSHFYQSHIYCKVSHRTLTLLILSTQSVSNFWQPLFYMMLIIIVNGLQVAT